MRFYTTEVLGPKRRLTPEGYLLCEDVPLARTGTMLYTPQEVPIDPDPVTGLVNIERLPEEVFRDETIASANGKSVVDEHPRSGLVDPTTWSQLTKGVVMNPRRGTGAQSDLLLGDLLITDAATIDAVNADKREVSCGYDTEYSQIRPGLGRQSNIIINHVALVESGRCGPRCRIYDHDTVPTTAKEKFFVQIRDFRNKLHAILRGEKAQADKEKELDGLLAEALVANGKTLDSACSLDAAEEEELRKKAEDARVAHDKAVDSRLDAMDKRVGDMEGTLKAIKETTDAINEEVKKAKETADKRAKDAEAEEAKRKEEEEKRKAEDAALEENLEKEAPPGTGDRARKAKDSAFLVDSFRDTVAKAEIIAPGIKLPAMDAAATPRATFDALCNLRRKALLLGTNDAATLTMVEQTMGLSSVDPEEVRTAIRALSCDAARTTFLAVAGVKAMDNNSRRSNAQPYRPVENTSSAGKGWNVESPAELNKKLAAHYGQTN